LISCLLLTVCSWTHSQDTSRITITSNQLRTTNLIFAEHKEYSKLIPLLQLEKANLIAINDSWNRTDSLKNIKINMQNQIISQQTEQLNSLQKSFKTKSLIGGSVVGISLIVTILCLILN
jgi:hypothetical protein